MGNKNKYKRVPKWQKQKDRKTISASIPRDKGVFTSKRSTTEVTSSLSDDDDQLSLQVLKSHTSPLQSTLQCNDSIEQPRHEAITSEIGKADSEINAKVTHSRTKIASSLKLQDDQPSSQLIESHKSPLQSTSGSHKCTDDCDDTDDHTLVVEAETKEDEFQAVTGRRLVDINHILNELQDKAHHNELFNCGLHNFRLISEKRQGLMSLFRFECNMCKKVCLVKSEDPNNKEQVNVNIAATCGIVASGIGYSQFEELFSSMDVPVFSTSYYSKLENEVFEKWAKTASSSMEAAAQMEKDIAIAEGRINKNGLPVVDVYLDGSWCARSYGSNQKAASGTAAIIGRKTGQVLYIGVKNKYCLVCSRAENKNEPAKEHKCFKNYTGSASSMEKEIIVEGFKTSIPMYGIIYGRMIADGDSSTYAAILNAKPYETEGVTVEKIECRNHILRNFCKKLRNMTKETKYALAHRQTLTEVRIMTMRKVIVQSIKHHKNSDRPRDVAISCLYNDITNCVAHVYGDHKMCQDYYCDKAKNDSNQQLNTVRSTTFIFRLNSIVSNVASKSRSLIEDVDTNTVECFNNVVAKFIGGKRVNFALKGGYQGRCSAAVVAFNRHDAISEVQKAFLNKSPRGRVKLVERKRAQKRKINMEHPIKKRRKLQAVDKKAVHDYGPASAAPDMSQDELEKAKDEFLKNLKTLTSDRDAIERSTVLQRDSSEWLEIRKNLITASNFGQICKRKIKISTAPLVKNILYQTNLSHIAGVAHGIENERQALQQLEKQENIHIRPCGLFIDKKYPFIGATPDGLVGEDMVVEIKCPLVAAKIGLQNAIMQNKIPIIKYDKQTCTSTINKKSNWYYQIQGQLHITDRQVCLFGIWVGESEPLLIKRIEREDNFWKQKMEPQLLKFYNKCLLPEIVDSRHSRGMPIRLITLEDDKENRDIGNALSTSPSEPPEHLTENVNIVNLPLSSSLENNIDSSTVLSPTEPSTQPSKESSHVNRVRFPLVSSSHQPHNMQPGPSCSRVVSFEDY